MNEVNLGLYSEDCYNVFMKISHLIIERGYKTTQIEQYEEMGECMIHAYFENKTKDTLKLSLNEWDGRIKLVGTDVLFMVNTIFTKVNKLIASGEFKIK